MRLGFTAGAFDLLHVGHIHLLARAKEKCDYLIVGLHVDPSIERKYKNKPIQTMFERFSQLQSCKYVNHVIPYETENDLLNILGVLKIDVRFLGEEYAQVGLVGENGITGEGIIPIEYIPRNHTYSSSELRERIKKA